MNIDDPRLTPGTLDPCWFGHGGIQPSDQRVNIILVFDRMLGVWDRHGPFGLMFFIANGMYHSVWVYLPSADVVSLRRWNCMMSEKFESSEMEIRSDVVAKNMDSKKKWIRTMPRQ